MVSVTLEVLWMVSDGIADFQFHIKFHCNNFQFLNYHGACQLYNKRNHQIGEYYSAGLWMVSDRIVDSLFFFKFHRSGPAIIFSFCAIMEHVSYPSKYLLIKQNTSLRWLVLLWKDYGLFLIELPIFNFSSNFTGPDLQ